MSSLRNFLISGAILALAASLASAQSIAPAQSGTVHYFEGVVSIDGIKLVSQRAHFSVIKENSVLETGEGRAEVLLTPGVVLRVAENSSVKMLDNRLLSTRVELVSGSAMLESDDPGESVKDPAVTVLHDGFQVQPVKFGVIEISATDVRVYKGQARVTSESGQIANVKENNAVALSSALTASKFDAKEADDLYLWTRDRSAYLAAGNMASAHTLSNSYSGGTYAGWNPAIWNGFSGGWYYNDALNMYSYLPFRGTVYGPFGYGLYNPMTIGYYYAPIYTWTGAGGARTGNLNGVALNGLPTRPVVTGTTPPRLSFAGAHPTLSSPAPGTQPVASMPAGEFPGPSRSSAVFGNQAPVNSGASNNSVSLAGRVPTTAPTAPAGGGAAMGGSAGAARGAAIGGRR